MKNHHRIEPSLELQLFRAADKGLMHKIYSAYLHHFINSAIYHFSCCADDAKEAFHLAVLKLIEYVKKNKDFKLQCCLKTFLFRMATNNLKNIFNSREKFATLDEQAFYINAIEYYTEDEPDGNILKTKKKNIKKLLKKLSVTDRRIMNLRYDKNLKWKEIANRMDKSEKYLRKRHCDIIGELREMMEGLGWM